MCIHTLFFGSTFNSSSKYQIQNTRTRTAKRGEQKTTASGPKSMESSVFHCFSFCWAQEDAMNFKEFNLYNTLCMKPRKCVEKKMHFITQYTRAFHSVIEESKANSGTANRLNDCVCQ